MSGNRALSNRSLQVSLFLLALLAIAVSGAFFLMYRANQERDALLAAAQEEELRAAAEEQARELQIQETQMRQAQLDRRKHLLAEARMQRAARDPAIRGRALAALKLAAAIEPGLDLRLEYLRCLDLPTVRQVNPVVRDFHLADAGKVPGTNLALEFHPAERWLASANSSVLLVDLLQQAAEQPSLLSTDSCFALAFSDTGDRLWREGASGSLRWELPASQPFILNRPANVKTVSALAINLQGRRIAAGVDEAGQPRVWDLENGRIVLKLSKPSITGKVTFQQLTRDGGFLAVLREKELGSQVQLFDLADGEEVFSTDLAGKAGCLALSEQGRFLAVGLENAVAIFEPRTKNELIRLRGPRGLVSSLVWDASSRLLASASAVDGTVGLWDSASWQLLASFETQMVALNRVALSPTGHWLAAGGADGRVRIWDLHAVRRALREAGLDWSVSPIPAEQKIPESSVQAIVMAGEHWQLLERYQEAINAYSKALSLEDKLPLVFRDRGEAFYQLRRYAPAAADLQKAKELQPDLIMRESYVRSLQFRGLGFAAAGQWNKAAPDFKAALQAGAERDNSLSENALVYLASGDPAGYRKFCSKLLDRLKEKEKPNVSYPALWTAAIGPGALPEYTRFIELAEDAVDTEPKSWLYQNTLAAILYRAGQFEPCLERIKLAIEAEGKEGRVRDWLFMALAYQQLGHVGDAKKWLDRAVNAFDQNSQADLLLSPGVTTHPWTERLDLYLLRHEARKLILGQVN